MPMQSLVTEGRVWRRSAGVPMTCTGRGLLVPGSSVEREELARILAERFRTSVEPPLRVEHFSVITPEIFPLVHGKDRVEDLGAFFRDIHRAVESLHDSLA